MDEMAAAGIPLLADRNAAWEAWRGWRVNYDTVLLNLARLVEAPPAPWVSDRSPVYVTSSQVSWLRFGAVEVGPGGRVGPLAGPALARWPPGSASASRRPPG